MRSMRISSFGGESACCAWRLGSVFFEFLDDIDEYLFTIAGAPCVRACVKTPGSYVGRAISRQPPSGRLLFSTSKSLLEAGCRLNSPPHKQLREFSHRLVSQGIRYFGCEIWKRSFTSHFGLSAPGAAT